MTNGRRNIGLVLLFCGNCGAKIRYRVDRFARRRVKGRYRIVCADCAAAIDAQTTLDEGGN